MRYFEKKDHDRIYECREREDGAGALSSGSFMVGWRIRRDINLAVAGEDQHVELKGFEVL